MSSAVAFIILLLLTGSSVAEQKVATTSESKNVRSFTEARSERVLELDVPSHHEFSALGYKFTISSNGRGRREGEGSAVRRLNLRLHKNDKLDRNVYYAEYQGDLLLLCEFTDGLNGGGFIARLNGRTMAIKWKRLIRGFNVGQGLIEHDHAYVTGIGFVGKVDLKSGVFAWKHDNLYTNGLRKDGSYGDSNFNSFETPKVEGDAVLFTEVENYGYPPTILKVQKRTGRILSISN